MIKIFIYCLSLFPLLALIVFTFFQLNKFQRNKKGEEERSELLVQEGDHSFQASKPYPILFIISMLILSLGFFWAWYSIPFNHGTPLFDGLSRYILFVSTAFLSFLNQTFYYLNSKLRKVIITSTLKTIILRYQFFKKSEVISVKDLSTSLYYSKGFFNTSIKITYGKLAPAPNELELVLPNKEAQAFMNFMTKHFSIHFYLEMSGD